MLCYSGDMLSSGGGADVAVIAIIQSCWNKFRQLPSLLTAKDTSVHVRGKMYCTVAV